MTTIKHICLFALTAMLVAGCGQVTPTNFYTLTPIATERAEGVDAESDLSVGIGPVVLAEYLDRPQVVARLHSNQMDLDDFDTWAEPLDAVIQRVMVRDIGTILDSDLVVGLPNERFVPIDYRVDIVVNRLDSGPSDEVTLEARWALTDDRNGDLVTTRLSMIKEPIAVDASTGQRVSAMSTVLGQLSREIATAIASAT